MFNKLNLGLLCVVLLGFPIAASAAQISNPTFNVKQNQISLAFGQSVQNNFEKFSIITFCYSQPNEFFRLPGRRNIELITMRGGRGSSYQPNTQSLIFGLSQDAMSPAVWRMYLGINFGIYVESPISDRINSRVTFGERIFIGVNVTDNIVFELYNRHLPSGSLVYENSRQGFAGLSAMWNF
ncbi:MAG: hypothetical protein LBU70_00725 [Chitinispirillales bacterium]|jgi:hypothetical protein|nr:hypothetical protein [Chitinispirillales bacterium]